MKQTLRSNNTLNSRVQSPVKKKGAIKALLLMGLLAVCSGKAFSQTISTAGFPVSTAGWVTGGSTFVNSDGSIKLTDPSPSEAGWLYYNTELDVTSCGAFSVDYDYNISDGGGGGGIAIADGIAFSFNSSLSGFVAGGGMGLPLGITGLVFTLDTYDNDGDGENPESELFGYPSATTYNEGDRSSNLLAGIQNTSYPFNGVLGGLGFIQDGSWRHITITYNAGNITVAYDGVIKMTGFFVINTPGYFGFSASTGEGWSLQQIKNVVITTAPVAAITGTTTMCGAGSTTSLSDVTLGGAWSSDNTNTVVVDGSGNVTAVNPGTANISYAVSNACSSSSTSIPVTVIAPTTFTASLDASDPIGSGSIDPLGVTSNCTGDMVYDITPNPGYHITDVVVNGAHLGPEYGYTFSGATGSNTIVAFFAPDCVPPTIACSGDVTVGNDPGTCGALVTYADASVTGTSPTVTYTQNSGSTFFLGTTNVTATATNGCGIQSCSFNVIVNDVQPPTAVCQPVDIYLSGATTITAAQINNGSSDNCTASGSLGLSLGASQTSFSCADVGTPVSVTLTVTDAAGNPATCSSLVTVHDDVKPTITAPANVVINGWCRPVSLVSAAASLGTPVTADNCGVAGVTNNAPALFPVGTTTVTWTVTDIHGNTATATQNVTVNPATLTFAPEIDNVSCHGGYNGHIDADVSGGTAPYTYSWSTGGAGLVIYDDLYFAPAGTYAVTATDAHSCAVSASYNITQPAALTITGTATAVSCNGGSNGSISTTVGGGTTPYSYSWSCSAAHGANPTGLPAGTYNVTVTDAHGCTICGSYIVTQPTAISISGTPANVTCNGAHNGSITASASGGTPGYSYTWSTGAHTASISGLAPAAYTLTVTDGHLCTASHSYTITQPGALAASVSVSPVYCVTGSSPYTIYIGYGPTSVTLNASATGGTPGYTYHWSPASGSGASISVSPTTTTTYTVTVTDAHGCTSTTTQTINVIDIRCADHKSVYICHYGGTISCGTSAVPGHISHGDYCGPCHKTGAKEAGETGSEPTDEGDAIKVYPNPSAGLFNIEIPAEHKDAVVVISDLTGRVIETRAVSGNSGEPVQFNLNNVARGIYLVKVNAGDKIYVDKLIVR